MLLTIPYLKNESFNIIYNILISDTKMVVLVTHGIKQNQKMS